MLHRAVGKRNTVRQTKWKTDRRHFKTRTFVFFFMFCDSFKHFVTLVVLPRKQCHSRQVIDVSCAFYTICIVKSHVKISLLWVCRLRTTKEHILWCEPPPPPRSPRFSKHWKKGGVTTFILNIITLRHKAQHQPAQQPNTLPNGVNHLSEHLSLKYKTP